MADNNWKSPAILFSIITALVAVVGLYINFTANGRKAELDRLEIESRQRQKDIEERNHQNINKERQEKIVKLYKQIDNKSNEIQTCNHLLQKAKIIMAETNFSGHSDRYDQAKEVYRFNDSLKSKLNIEKDSLSKLVWRLHDEN